MFKWVCFASAVLFASALLLLIQEIFGSDLKQIDTAEELLVGLNKEMVGVILPLAKSKQEILYRV